MRGLSMDIITYCATEISRLMQEAMDKLKTGTVDFTDLVNFTQDKMRGLTIYLIEEMMNTVEMSLYKDPKRKKEYRVQRTGDEKVISTIVGDVKLTRRYYQNKTTKEFVYLLDNYLGLDAHQRIDSGLEAELYELATTQSYQKSIDSFRHTGIYSRQTVKNIVHKYQPDSLSLPIESTRQVPYLYIEADEDHVAYQDGKNREMRLVYIHEGYEASSNKIKRKKLKVIRRFTGHYEDSDEIWEDVSYFLTQQYDLDACKGIYLSGDGAAWIKKGLDYLPSMTQFVLDPYHTQKYVKKACVGLPQASIYPTLNAWIREDKLEYMKDYFNTRLSDPALTNASRESLKKTKRYIIGNWGAIQRQKDPHYIGCSAEGHVSHYLSERLSSRPLGWSKRGAENIAQARIYQFNGGDIKEWIKQEHEAKHKQRKIEKLDGRITRKYQLQYEWAGKLPILEYSHHTQTRQVFKSIIGY